MGLAVGLVLVGEEHDAELADQRIEGAVLERQRRRVRRLEFDLLVGPEFSPCDLQHGRIEIACDQMRGVRQRGPEQSRDDAGSRGDFQNVA
jgi:hypothetical protein